MNIVKKLRLARLRRALAIAKTRLNLAVAHRWTNAIATRRYWVGYYQRRIALLEDREEAEMGGAN